MLYRLSVNYTAIAIVKVYSSPKYKGAKQSAFTMLTQLALVGDFRRQKFAADLLLSLKTYDDNIHYQIHKNNFNNIHFLYFSQAKPPK